MSTTSVVAGRNATPVSSYQPPAKHHGIGGLRPENRRVPRRRARNAPAKLDSQLARDDIFEDGKRFLWVSERTGWRNLYLYDLSGKLLQTLTKNEFEVDRDRARG